MVYLLYLVSITHLIYTRYPKGNQMTTDITVVLANQQHAPYPGTGGKQVVSTDPDRVVLPALTF